MSYARPIDHEPGSGGARVTSVLWTSSLSILRRFAGLAVVVALLGTVSLAGPVAASRPYDSGVTYVLGKASPYVTSSCGAGSVCVNVRTTNTCNDAGTAICGAYTPPGSAADSAGRSRTDTDGTVAGELVWNGGERMYNNLSTGRPFCAYFSVSYNGTNGYRRANAGSGWNTMPFTGAGSLAVIPTTTGWVCWT